MLIHHEVVKLGATANVLIHFAARVRVAASETIHAQRLVRVLSASDLLQVPLIPQKPGQRLRTTRWESAALLNQTARRRAQ